MGDLGEVPGLPPKYGGLTFLADNPNVILIGGNANEESGKLYSVQVTRSADKHIVGFSGTAQLFAEAAYNDGGVVYGPGKVLFLARWPVNQLGQTKFGSALTDKIISLIDVGVAESPGGLYFVPSGFPGAGQLKLVSWPSGRFYTLNYVADDNGTFTITSATLETTVSGGPEGFIYVPTGSPQLAESMLFSEYSEGMISTYKYDAKGNPIPETRQVFISGLAGAEGAAIDPLTGDYLFSTFRFANKVIVVRGFAPPPSADLSISKTADVTRAYVGAQLKYTIAVANQGPDAASDVTAVDSLPAAITPVSANATQGTCEIAGNTLTCHLGTLAAGATATITLVIVPTQAGSLTNSAVVSAVETEPNAANNTATIVTPVEAGAAQLGIDMYAGLDITGLVGRTYRIECKPQAEPQTAWVALTNLVLPASPYLWIDVSSTNAPIRFYQAVLLP